MRICFIIFNRSSNKSDISNTCSATSISELDNSEDEDSGSDINIEDLKEAPGEEEEIHQIRIWAVQSRIPKKELK